MLSPRFVAPDLSNFAGPPFVNVGAALSTVIAGLCDKPREESLPESPPLDSVSSKFSASSKAFPLLSALSLSPRPTFALLATAVLVLTDVTPGILPFGRAS